MGWAAQVMDSVKRNQELPFLERRHIRAVREFTPSWFTACMGTGATALAIGNIPFKFQGQLEIGTAIWALNVLVFIFFSCLFLGRCIFFPDTIGPLMRHKSEPLFLGAIPMAFAVITNGFVLFFAHHMAPPTALLAACILWFLNLPMTLFTSLVFPFFIISRHSNTPESMTAVWLLPIVPSNVAAGSAGVLAVAHASAVGSEVLQHTSTVRAVIFIGSLLFSYGLLLTLTITTIYWHRLMVHHLPPAAQLISSFLPVGALAMSAFSAINLGSAALFKFPEADPSLGDISVSLHATGLFLGIMLWAYAMWWMVVAAASVVDNLRHLSFNLGWWGSVFPTGTMSVLTGRIAHLLGLEALKVVAVVFTAINVSLWLGVSIMTFKKGWKGRLFYAPCLHTFEQAVAAAAADKDDRAVARARSELLCSDPGLSGLYDAEVHGGGAAVNGADRGPRAIPEGDEDTRGPRGCGEGRASSVSKASEEQV